MSNNNQRGSFSGKLGFVISAAASAVGLGNIWRFPYLTAKYGGGFFLLIYIIIACTFGFSLLIAEIGLGRKTHQSAINCYSSLDKKFGFVGIITSIITIVITSYYCVIGGWIIKYLVLFVTNNANIAVNDSYFGSFISNNTEPMIYYIIFFALTILVIKGGVENGIEKVSKIMMPVLLFLIIIIAGYVLTLPGSMEGVKYYITPKASDVNPTTFLNSLTQVFYSLSLAMGIMITYGSYIKKEIDMEQSAVQIIIFDSIIAILAGLVIIPAVFALGSQEELSAGPGLIFVVLPKVFMSLPSPMGMIVGSLFFVLVLFAALTSSISLLEAVVSTIDDKFTKGNRNNAIIISVVICLALGTLSCLGYGTLANVTFFKMQFLDLFDYISNNVLMPITAFFTCIFVGYIIKPKAIIDEVKISSKFKAENLFVVVMKYVAPVILVIVFLTSIGIIK